MSECLHGAHVGYAQAVPAVKICNWKDLSAQKIVNVRGQNTWSRFLNRLSMGLSVCIGESCRIIAVLTSSGPVEQTVFVFPEIVYVSHGSVCFQDVLGRARTRAENGW